MHRSAPARAAVALAAASALRWCTAICSASPATATRPSNSRKRRTPVLCQNRPAPRRAHETRLQPAHVLPIALGLGRCLSRYRGSSGAAGALWQVRHRWPIRWPVRWERRRRLLAVSPAPRAPRAEVQRMPAPPWWTPSLPSAASGTSGASARAPREAQVGLGPAEAQQAPPRPRRQPQEAVRAPQEKRALPDREPPARGRQARAWSRGASCAGGLRAANPGSAAARRWPAYGPKRQRFPCTGRSAPSLRKCAAGQQQP